MNINDLYYVLENRKVFPEPNIFHWSKWFEETRTNNSRLVGNTCIKEEHGAAVIYVSTVFLGVDVGFSSNPKNPIVWESRVIGGDMDGQHTRCAGGWEDAEKMHQKMVDNARKHEVTKKRKAERKLILDLATQIASGDPLV